MIVCTIAGIDDRDTRPAGGYNGSAFLGMAHGNDIRIAAHGLHRIRQTLALGGRRGTGLAEANNAATQPVHGRFEAKAGTGGGFKEQGSQQLMAAGILILLRIGDNIFCNRDQLVDFLNGQIGNVHQIFHYFAPFTAR